MEYLEIIEIPKQHARNYATKYMISEKLALFKIISEKQGVKFKDIDTNEKFYWEDDIFFVHMQKSTQGKDLIRKDVPSAPKIVIVYENPSTYQIVGWVKTINFKQKEIMEIPNYGSGRMMRPTEFNPIINYFKVEKKKEEELEKKNQRYFPLHVHTEYSAGDCVLKTKTIAEELEKMGFKGAGVSDHGHLNGTYYFQKDIAAKGLKPIIGIEAYVLIEEEYKKEAKRFHLCIWVKNEIGWKNLLKLNYKSCTEGFYYKPRFLLKDIIENKEGLIISSACLNGIPNFFIGQKDYEKADYYAKLLKKEFGNDFYIEIMPHYNIEKFKENMQKLYSLAKENGIKCIFSCDAHYLKGEKEVHNAHVSIARRTNYTTAYDGDTFYIMDDVEAEELLIKKMDFNKEQVEELFRNTFEIYNKCDFTIKKINPKDSFPVLSETPDETLYNKIITHPEAKKYPERIELEFNRIKEKGYSNYFLLVKDMYDIADSINCKYGPGRGSIGGSLVAFCLGLHHCHSIKHDLLFDRFLSESRKDMPDVDMDFQDSKRAELIEKIIEKYHRENVVGIITFAEYHGKGVIRDVGRIFNIPIPEIEKVANLVVTRSGGDMRQDFSFEDTLNEFEGGKEFAKKYPVACKLAVKLEGKIRHLGQHSAGMVITKNPFYFYAPVFRVNDVIVSGWEKKAIEELGLVKMDVLGLKAVDILQKTCERAGIKYEDLPLEFNDEKVYNKVFKEGKTEGIFQFESIGLSKLIKDLAPDNFERLVDATALYRPGPLHSGLCALYVERVRGTKPIEYPHELMKDITEKTLGIIIYQEQIMKIMHDIGGLSWATSEMIRKAISKSMGKSIFDELQSQFVKNAKDNGLDEKDAIKIFTATSMFGSYGYNLSHSVEYTVISYWMGFLKTYYPIEFYTSILEREGDSTQEKRYIFAAKREGIPVVAPNINKSEINYSSREGKIICGLKSIKGFGTNKAKKIIHHQPYKNIFSIIKKHSKKDIETIIKAGALDDFIPSRKWAIENLDTLINNKIEPGQMTLFSNDTIIIPKTAEEYELKELITLQNDVLNFPSEKHPIELAENPLEKYVNFELISNLTFDEPSDERWVRGLVTFINFKQEGLEGSWTMFDNVLERKYAHLNINDESGGNILVHLSPEQYTKYKKQLEKKSFMVAIKGSSVKGYQKIYGDALLILGEDYDSNANIFRYVNGESDKIREQEKKNYRFVDVIKTVRYKVSKNKKPYALLKFKFYKDFLMVFDLTSNIFEAGEVVCGFVTNQKFLKVQKRC